MARQPKNTFHASPQTPTREQLPEFEPGEQYEITIDRVVEVAPDMYARPSSSKIVVSGEKAHEIRDAIISAKKIQLLG